MHVVDHAGPVGVVGLVEVEVLGVEKLAVATGPVLVPDPTRRNALGAHEGCKLSRPALGVWAVTAMFRVRGDPRREHPRKRKLGDPSGEVRVGFDHVEWVIADEDAQIEAVVKKLDRRLFGIGLAEIEPTESSVVDQQAVRAGAEVERDGNARRQLVLAFEVAPFLGPHDELVATVLGLFVALAHSVVAIAALMNELDRDAVDVLAQLRIDLRGDAQSTRVVVAGEREPHRRLIAGRSAQLDLQGGRVAGDARDGPRFGPRGDHPLVEGAFLPRDRRETERPRCFDQRLTIRPHDAKREVGLRHLCAPT